MSVSCARCFVVAQSLEFCNDICDRNHCRDDCAVYWLNLEGEVNGKTTLSLMPRAFQYHCLLIDVHESVVPQNSCDAFS